MRYFALILCTVCFILLLSEVESAKSSKKSKTKKSRQSAGGNSGSTSSSTESSQSSPRSSKTKSASITGEEITHDLVMEPIQFSDPTDPTYSPGKHGIVFSWHGMDPDKTSPLYDQRFGEVQTIGKGFEFQVAVRSCYDAHPNIPMYLFTNAEYLDRDTMQLLHRAYKVDLMRESGLDKLYQQTHDPKFGFGTKAYSVVTGWKWGVLPEWVIHFDVDITIIQVSNRWNLMTMFEPLQYYDIAGVMEGYSTSLNRENQDHALAVGAGWEMNTGAWAVKRSTMPLLVKWVDMFMQQPHRFAEFQSGEQQAFMLALQESPQYRLFALPPIFNFRRATLHARNGPVNPVMFHSHTFSFANTNISNYKEVAKHAAMLTFDDCFQHMKIISGPYPFLCDMLVV